MCWRLKCPFPSFLPPLPRYRHSGHAVPVPHRRRGGEAGLRGARASFVTCLPVSAREGEGEGLYSVPPAAVTAGVPGGEDPFSPGLRATVHVALRAGGGGGL